MRMISLETVQKGLARAAMGAVQMGRDDLFSAVSLGAAGIAVQCEESGEMTREEAYAAFDEGVSRFFQ